MARHDEQTKKLKKKADVLFSKLVRAKAGKCERCDRRPPAVVLHCSHVMSRKYTATRWSLDNALAMCAGCHFWQHQNPAENSLFLLKKVGQEKLDQLLERATSYAGLVTRANYEEIVADLQQQLDVLAL